MPINFGKYSSLKLPMSDYYLNVYFLIGISYPKVKGVCGKVAAINAANAVLKWIKREEETHFITTSGSW